MLKHTGLLSFVLLICGLLFTILRWRGGLHMTFSQHVARSRISTIYYSVLFALTLPLLSLFLIGWLVPTFQLSAWFTFFVIVSVTAQFLCTLVPETGGKKTVVHRILTSISGVSLLPLMAMIAVSPNIPPTGKAVAWASLAVMIVLLAIALRNQKGYRYALLLQVGYYALFFATVFSVTYF